jgi:predicted TIM-barrel fold metal-dependent hydrolase
MKLDDMIIVSVDDHVVEPPDLFERHLPEKYKELAPHVIRTPDGSDVWQFLDTQVPNIGLNAVAGRPPEEYGVDPTAFEEIREGCFNIEKRILDMNANGVLGSLNFPSLPGFAGRLFGALEDKDAARILTEAYNDWHIDEWCGTFPGRFIPLAVPAIWDPEVTAAEIRRVAKKGCHAITMPENPVPLGLPSLHSDHWDPVWKACEDEGTVVCMHIGSSSKLAVTAPDAPFDVTIVLQPMNIVMCAADLVYSPIWKKFPGVRIALSEGGIGWVPYFLERLDHSYRTHKAWTHADFGDQTASEFFMDHVILCFITDPVGLKLVRDHIGVDKVTVEIDYPHSDANWPRAPEKLMGEFTEAALKDDEIDAMTHLNAMREFHYDPFAHRPREKCTVGALRAEAVGVDVTPTPMAKRDKVDREGPVTIMDFTPTA